MTDVPVLDISGINTPSWAQVLQRSTRVKQHDAAPPPPTHYLTYCSVPTVRPKSGRPCHRDRVNPLHRSLP